MDMKDSKLFSPLKVGSLTLRNRVGMAPMSMDYEAKAGNRAQAPRGHLRPPRRGRHRLCHDRRRHD